LEDGFDQVNGLARPGVARLNADGSLDESFDPAQVLMSGVNCLALEADGKILVGGWAEGFEVYNGPSTYPLVRLNRDGSLDPTFRVVMGPVTALAFQADGQLVIGGSYSVNGIAINGIARLNSWLWRDPFVERQVRGTTAELLVQLPYGVTNYIISEQLPSDVGITSVGPGGSYNAVSHTVSFGPFSGVPTENFYYEVRPGVLGQHVFHLVGDAMANGVASPVIGDDYGFFRVLLPGFRLHLRLRPLSQQTAIQIEGSPGQVCRIDASTNLVDWMGIGTVTNGYWWNELVDPDAATCLQRFYRATLHE